jgi:hypothetical protein
LTGGFVLNFSSYTGLASALIALTIRYKRSFAEESRRVKGLFSFASSAQFVTHVRQPVAAPENPAIAAAFRDQKLSSCPLAG